MSENLQKKLKEFLKTLSDEELKELGVSLNSKNDVKDASNIASTPDPLTVKISSILQDFGIPTNVCGYLYLLDAIAIVVKNPTSVRYIMYDVYTPVGKKYSIAKNNVERGIRHAIELGFERDNDEKLHNLFSKYLENDKTKPANSEFISLIADHIRLGRL